MLDPGPDVLLIIVHQQGPQGQADLYKDSVPVQLLPVLKIAILQPPLGRVIDP